MPGEFDYYVLALSWSPDYCSTHPQDTQQCGQKRYGFVLHGLWPQYEKGYPQNCSNDPLPPDARQAHADLYPSDALMDHEWDKHGTCSGLSANDYLELSDEIKQSVRIPTRYQAPAEPFRTTIGEVRLELTSVNADLPADSITMVCSGSGQFLKELRVCHDKDGHARGCSQDVVKQMTSSCAQPDFVVKSVR